MWIVNRYHDSGLVRSGRLETLQTVVGVVDGQIVRLLPSAAICNLERRTKHIGGVTGHCKRKRQWWHTHVWCLGTGQCRRWADCERWSWTEPTTRGPLDGWTSPTTNWGISVVLSIGKLVIFDYTWIWRCRGCSGGSEKWAANSNCLNLKKKIFIFNLGAGFT
jgi:hypothetical protein